MALTFHNCLICKKLFSSQGTTAKYCSVACRATHQRQRMQPEKVIKLRAEGMSVRTIAAKLGISWTTVDRVLKKDKEDGLRRRVESTSPAEWPELALRMHEEGLGKRIIHYAFGLGKPKLEQMLEDALAARQEALPPVIPERVIKARQAREQAKKQALRDQKRAAAKAKAEWERKLAQSTFVGVEDQPITLQVRLLDASPRLTPSGVVTQVLLEDDSHHIVTTAMSRPPQFPREPFLIEGVVKGHLFTANGLQTFISRATFPGLER